MADINIDEFYQDCLKTLVQLYNAFPKLSTVYIDDLISNSGTDEFGIPNHRHRACFDTLLWLAAEGYIRYQDNIRHDALDQVVLTEKSFLRLSLPIIDHETGDGENQLPPLVARKQSTLAWQCREALKNGGSNAIATTAQTFFTVD
ncbi:MAG: hypothetical protein ACPGEF_07785 [Endozoicomonas sp.]